MTFIRGKISEYMRSGEPATQPSEEPKPAVFKLEIYFGGGTQATYSYGDLVTASRRFYELNDSLAKGDRSFMMTGGVVALQNVTYIGISTGPLSRDAVGMD